MEVGGAALPPDRADGGRRGAGHDSAVALGVLGPMAVAIMGGLIVATALTLLFLPALYAAWFRVKKPRTTRQCGRRTVVRIKLVLQSKNTSVTLVNLFIPVR